MNIRLTSILCLILAAETVSSDEIQVETLEKRLQAAVEKSLPPSVAITETREGGFGAFSGVVVNADGDILAAAHAVKPGNRYLVHFGDGRRFRAVGKGINRKTDCALLKITESGSWPFAEMGDSTQLKPGEPLFAISHPGVHRPDRGPVVRFGKVIKPLSERLGMIQSSVKMEPGDSGGPLFDLDGKVVGIRSQIQQSVKENFDIPIASFRLYWDQLQKEEEFKIDRIPGLPDLGLEARRMRRGTARVSSIVPDGPAARAGLEVDDLITKAEGSDDRGSVLDRITSRYLSGDREIELEVTRAEQSKKVILTLPPNELEVTAVNDSREANEERVTVGDLAKELQALESQKDDVTAVIRSDKNDESIDVFGVFVAQPGCVVAKSSCVGEKPLIRNDKGDWLVAEILARDESDDLVLLRAPLQNATYIKMDESMNRIRLPDQGKLLLSPRPDDVGVVSVAGSRLFSVPRGEGRGYLGVVLATKEERVVIEEIVEGGAAQKAGLKVGDIVHAVDGRKIDQPSDMTGYLRNSVPKDRVAIEFERDGTERTMKITLGEVLKPTRHVAEFFDGGKSNRRDGFNQVFVHDAELFPHECGGPLFDLSGDFIGMNIARYSRTQSFALPAKRIRDFVSKNLP